jgi:hypothetical protein
MATLRHVGSAIAGAVAVAIAVLPLVGAAWAQRPLTPFFEFPPPLAIPTDYPRFSAWAAGLLIAGLIAVAAFVVAVIWRVPVAASQPLVRPHHAAVGAGQRRRATVVLALALWWTATWWVLAWTRFEWFAWAQRFTFFPLWLGLIVTMNALVWRRDGTCLMLRRPLRWIALYGVSAGFWWGFEWLNRFVQNWHYLGVESFGAAAYAIHASLCFSTVLPAVASIREWLGNDRPWLLRMARAPQCPALQQRRTGFTLVVIASAALVLVGFRPRESYAGVWVAPLLLSVGWLILFRPSALALVGRGDWRPVVSWALAALICGGFWEMWNVLSLAKWVYTVPYVERWHVFEMPLLGYAGYLPFGLLCGLATTWVAGERTPSA